MSRVIPHTIAETYTPVLLARRARRMRAHNQRANVFAPSELEPRSLQETITVVLIRPIRLFSEPIILFTCLFLALLFAIYYLFFEAYPLIFKGTCQSSLLKYYLLTFIQACTDSTPAAPLSHSFQVRAALLT